VNLATAVPESGALPPGGLPNLSNVGVTSTTAGGNASLPTFVLTFDGTPPAAAVINPVAGDNIVNAVERDGGVIVSGTAEAGATVTVAWGQQVRTAVADDAGAWQAPAFDRASIPGDGDHTITAVVQDLAGNNSPVTPLKVNVNTAPPKIDLSPVAGNGKVNAAEAGNVTFAGATDPNASVTVTWNNFTKTDTADGSGNWSATFTGAEVPNPGASAGQEAAYTIAVTNVVGNVASASGSVLVDRVAPLAPTIAPVAVDDIVNATEAAAGVVVRGSGEPGSIILLDWAGRTASAPVDVNGNWQATFASSNLPPDGNRTISATAQDDAGNQAAGSPRSIAVESGPAPLAVTSVGGADGIVSLADAGSAVFVGTAAANAQINVVWNGIVRPTTANASGGWTASFTGAEIPVADGLPVSYLVNTTSPAGNTNFVTGSVVVDTVAPDVPAITTSQVVGTAFSATGTGTPGSTVSVEIDTTPLVLGDPVTTLTAVVGGTGTWDISNANLNLPPFTLSVTAHASARDQAGNLSGTSPDQVILVNAAGGSDAALDSSELLSSSETDAPGALAAAPAAALPVPSPEPSPTPFQDIAVLAPLSPTIEPYA
jgi:hypothetical protein